MAGRGTDIVLGGGDAGARASESSPLGGLYVIGTNRHESRRVDDQLRGRAGRQGDPGSLAVLHQPRGRSHQPLRRAVADSAARIARAPAGRAGRRPDRPPRDRPRAADHRGPELRDPPDAVAILVDGRGAAAADRARAARNCCANDIGADGLRRGGPRAPRGAGSARSVPRSCAGAENRLTLLAARPAVERSSGAHRGHPRGHPPAAVRRARAADRVPAADHRRLRRDDGRTARRRGGGLRDAVGRGRARSTWTAPGLRGPAATWTYLVNDNPFSTLGMSLIAPGNFGVSLATAFIALLPTCRSPGLVVRDHVPRAAAANRGKHTAGASGPRLNLGATRVPRLSSKEWLFVPEA